MDEINPTRAPNGYGFIHGRAAGSSGLVAAVGPLIPRIGLRPAMRLIVRALAPIWVRRPVDVRTAAPPEVLLSCLATMARKVPENNVRLWFSPLPGQPASFTARLAPAADRGGWLRFLHATVEPMDGGSRVVGWFQVPAFIAWIRNS
jgi:hypothetical protein